jgi:TPP-dependent pyruvate/acetoin dehydrogenase alpha subunit
MMKTITKTSIDKTTLLWLYERMRLIREFKEQLRVKVKYCTITGLQWSKLCFVRV